MVGFCGYKPFTPHSTLAESINLFSCASVLSFTSKKRINKEGALLISCRSTRFQKCFNLYSDHIMLYVPFVTFSLIDTADSYFSLRGQTL